MKRFAVVLALLTGAAALGADTKTPKELEGTYKMTYGERDGKAAEKSLTDMVTVTIQGDELIMSVSPNDKKVAKIKVNPEAKPATIDLTPTDGEEKGKTFAGIYKLEKGELTLAFSQKGDRPKEFKSDNEGFLLKLKKVEKK